MESEFKKVSEGLIKWASVGVYINGKEITGITPLNYEKAPEPVDTFVFFDDHLRL